MTSLLGLDPGSYDSHALHSPERIFPETNCYTDLWIELVHALGHDPLAMLGCCAVVDWEGDQWTFFKPAFSDLERLYGLETYELALYRSLPDHIVEQLELGRFVIVEVDGYFLPDTAGRSYRESHEKTSIVVESLDRSARSLRYFHNGGFWQAAGDDYLGVLRLDTRPAADLPPYAELVRRDRLPACAPDLLRDEARTAFASHLARRPGRNPVMAFGEHLADQLPHLADESDYHVYAFATLRQCGAAWDAASAFVAWLDGPTTPAADGFATLAAASKTMLLKLARAAATGRPFDPSEPIAEMARVWDETLDRLGT
jgi:hypothetical protein